MTTTRARISPPATYATLTLIGCVTVVACQLAAFDAGAAFAKIFASTAFITTALTAGALQSRYGQIMLAGLVFSWLGDVFLIGRGEPWFLAGLSAFLLAHLVYIAAFAEQGLDRRWGLSALLPVVAASVAASVWLTPYLPEGMVLPVRLYTLAISVMLVAAIATRGAGATPLIAAGALCFYVSDLAVAARQFVEPGFPPYVWGLPLYYAGQVMLALSVRDAAQAAPSTGSAMRSGSG